MTKSYKLVVGDFTIALSLLKGIVILLGKISIGSWGMTRKMRKVLGKTNSRAIYMGRRLS